MARAVRISQESDEIIHELMRLTEKSKTEIIHKALVSYRFREKMRQFNDSYARLRADKQAWAEELEERGEI